MQESEVTQIPEMTEATLETNVAPESTESVTDVTIDPIYKHKDGRIFTKQEFLNSGVDENRIKDGLSKGLLVQIGDTEDPDQQFQHKDGRVFSVADFTAEGVGKDRIAKGIETGMIVPIEKKNQIQEPKGLGGLTLQGGGLKFGTPTPAPTQDEISRNLIEKSNIFDLVKGSETNPDFQKAVVDKKIDRDQINEMDRLLTETPVAQNFWEDKIDEKTGKLIKDLDKTKEILSNSYNETDGYHKSNFEKKYNGLKLANSIYKGFASHLNPDEAETITDNILNKLLNESKTETTTDSEGNTDITVKSIDVPTLQNNAKETYKELINALNFNNIENKEEVLNNFRNYVGRYYGKMAFTDIDNSSGNYIYTAPENKILSEPQLIAWKYLQDTNPEAANTYKAAFIKDEDVKNYSTQLQKQKALRDLQIIGANLSLPEIYDRYKKDIGSLLGVKNQLDKIDINEDGTQYQWESPEAREEAIKSLNNQLNEFAGNISQYENLINRYEGYLEGAKTSPDYAEANKQDADILSQELLDSPTSSGWLGLKYPLGRLGSSILNTALGVADLIKTPFLSDYEKTINAAQNLGLNSQIEKNLYVTQRDRGMSGINNYMKPEFEAEFNKIKDNPNLSVDQKRQQVSKLILNNPGGVTTDYSGQEKNTTLNSMYYSLVDMAADLVPYLAVEAYTGGGATPALASRAAKFKNIHVSF